MARDVSRGLSAIVLAAGANTRLKGIVPPYMKPLMLVNGKPLVQHALDHAKMWGADDITLVTSPHNTVMLASVVQHKYNGVVYAEQEKPLGPVDAIRRGLDFAKREHLLVLCADNVFSKLGDNEVRHVRGQMSGSGLSFFGSRRLASDESLRFTRWTEVKDRLGVDLIPSGPGPLGNGCWIGPLLLWTENVRDVIQRFGDLVAEDEFDMSELIMRCTGGGTQLRPLNMLCEDLGIPEEWQDAKGRVRQAREELPSHDGEGKQRRRRR